MKRKVAQFNNRLIVILFKQLMELVPANCFSLEELTEAYNQTRIDYIVPMPMNVARLRNYIHVYDVDLAESCVACDSEGILGIGMLGIRQEQGWITRLGVLPINRRRGTGRAILNQLLASAARLGLRTVCLEVIKGNTPAYKLFRDSGFVETRELLVARRPPKPGQASEGTKVSQDNIRRVTTLNHEDALVLLAHRRGHINWLNDIGSMHNLRNLTALIVELKNGGRGWVTYHASLLQLTRIIVEVAVGHPAEVVAAVLNTLHRRHPTQDAIVENIPADGRWPGYQEAGYFVAFERIEMVKDMESS